MTQTPTVGQIVHFYDHTRPRDASGEPGPHAAIITATAPGDVVNLTVFPDGYPPVCIAGVPCGGGKWETPQPVKIGAYWVWPPRE